MIKRIIYALSSIIILILFSIIIQKMYIGFQINRAEQSSGLTIVQALNIGMNEAKKWDKQAQPLYLTSVDDELGTKSGSTGLREKWNLQVSTPDNKRAVISIRNGNFEKLYPGIGPYLPEKVIPDIDPNLDSPGFVQKSINDGLLPGKEWANGYHFILQEIKGQTVLTVVGLDKNEQQQKLNFNFITGEKLNY